MDYNSLLYVYGILTMDAIIINNFFDDFDNIKDEFKKIPLYATNDWNKKFNVSGASYDETWPGKRSESFGDSNPFLNNLIYKELRSKTSLLFDGIHLDMYSYVHLRLDTDNDADFIHCDPCDYTLIVFLSETNLKSGTALYPPRSNTPDVMANFVQNRAFLFKGYIRHKAIHNHGDSIENGRLTLNCFIKQKKR